MSSDLSED